MNTIFTLTQNDEPFTVTITPDGEVLNGSQHLREDDDPEVFEIVGFIRNGKQTDLADGLADPSKMIGQHLVVALWGAETTRTLATITATTPATDHGDDGRSS